MSRSIHDTRRFLHEALHDDYADPALRQDLVERARGNLRKQQAIKQQVRTRRVRPMPPPSVDPDQVPIFVTDEGPFVHHPATEEDLRAVMRRLPRGVLDGLCGIHLSLDKRRRGPPGRLQRDPFIGRLGLELLPGVFFSSPFGLYDRGGQSIRLFACVHEAGAPGPLAIYLKFHVLTTFLHETAHHFDHAFRTSGDRWLMDDEEQVEHYATARAHDLVLAHVVPYVEERYPGECKALARWMKAHGDVALPLALLTDDPGMADPEAGQPALWALAHAVAAGGDPLRTRYEFARHLHFSGLDDQAQAVLHGRLADPPRLLSAIGLSASIAAYQGRPAEAEALCAAIVDQDPDRYAAWSVLVKVYRQQGRWGHLQAAASRAIELASSDADRMQNLRHRARALLEQGRHDSLDQDLAALKQAGGPDDRCFAEVMWVLVLCRTGRWDQALLASRRLLRLSGYRPYRAELAAVRFESARQLGRPGEAGDFGDDDLRALRAGQHDAWADRLARWI